MEIADKNLRLTFSRAIDTIAEAIINRDNTREIMQAIAAAAGNALATDRCLIYDVDLERNLLLGLCEWIDPQSENAAGSAGMYNLDAFGKGIKFMWEKQIWLEIASASTDLSSELFFRQAEALNMLCYPFMFRDKGFYCLVFSQLHKTRRWREEEFDFLRSVAGLVTIAIQKISLINSQRQADMALQMAEERFAKMFNASPNPMAINRFGDGHFISVNDSFERITGYSRSEAAGNTVAGLNLIPNPKDFHSMLKALYKKGGITNQEISLQGKTGQQYIILLSAESIMLNSEKCVLSIMTDITERKRIEKEMARLDRLNLMGQMAAGIGHEIRNPMTSIRGFLQILMGKEECINYREYFNLMIEELDRANSIITEFLSMAKNRPSQLKLLNLNDIINTLQPLIEADARNSNKNVNVQLEDMPDLMLNDKEIRQLILNIVRNGMEAMLPGGNLTIRTFADSGVAVLEITDQGKGIDTAIIDQIGTPFFTTKEQGTGLGLAICESIAGRHNADISLVSRPDGTTFYVRFKT